MAKQTEAQAEKIRLARNAKQRARREKARNDKGQVGKFKPFKTLSTADKEEMIELSSVLTKTQIADHFGMCANTLRRIEKDDPEVGVILKKGKSQTIADVANSLINQAKNGSVSAAIFYLKTQGGWKETQIVQQETKPVKTFSDMYNDNTDEDEDY